ncbi:MAG TPA: hypothetical protein VGX50_11725 [Longimicrobium sp.]|nr:hypothetical protein [Longimicrobium sp.]
MTPDPPFTRRPADVPLEVLRDFVREMAELYSYRGLATRLGMGHETVRKFITRRTELPHPRQREAYAAFFLELHPGGYVEATRTEDRARPLPQLKRLLPPERGEAAAVLDRIFDLAARHPDELPEQADAVRAWMQRLLAAEFDAELRYTAGRRPSAATETPG